MRNKRMLIIVGSMTVLTSLALVFAFAKQNFNPFRPGPGEKHSASEPKIEIAGRDNEGGLPTGDDPWAEIDQLVKAYQINGGVVYRGIVKLIDDNGENEKLLETHPFEYSFYKGHFHYSLDSMEFVSQKDLVLFVDHRNKLISLSPQQLQQHAAVKLFDIDAFAKAMKAQHAYALVTQSGNEKMLTIDSIQDATVQGYRIYYDPATYKISKMLIGMQRLSPLDEEQISEESSGDMENDTSTGDDEIVVETYDYYLEIIYMESQPLVFAKDQFNPAGKFIEWADKTALVKPRYKNYELINLKEEEPNTFQHSDE